MARQAAFVSFFPLTHIHTYKTHRLVQREEGGGGGRGCRSGTMTWAAIMMKNPSLSLPLLILSGTSFCNHKHTIYPLHGCWSVTLIDGPKCSPDSRLSVTLLFGIYLTPVLSPFHVHTFFVVAHDASFALPIKHHHILCLTFTHTQTRIAAVFTR